MALTTDRNDIEYMLRRIAFMVMILTSLFTAYRTGQCLWMRYPSCSDSVFDQILSLAYIWMFYPILIHMSAIDFPAFRRFVVGLAKRFVFWSLSVSFHRKLTFPTSSVTNYCRLARRRETIFSSILSLIGGVTFSAVSLQAIFFARILVELGRGLIHLAFTTSGGYDLLSHDFSPIQKSYRLEPVTSTQLAIGSLYCSERIPC